MIQSNEKRFKKANKRIKMFIKRSNNTLFRFKVLIIWHIDRSFPSGHAFRFNFLQEAKDLYCNP